MRVPTASLAPKVPLGKVSFGKVLLGKVLLGKVLLGKVPLGKVPLATLLLGSALVGSAPRGAAAKGAFSEDRQAARDACAADAKSLCSDITPGGGRVMLCVRSHDDKVSKPCHDALDKLRADRRSAS